MKYSPSIALVNIGRLIDELTLINELLGKPVLGGAFDVERARRARAHTPPRRQHRRDRARARIAFVVRALTVRARDGVVLCAHIRRPRVRVRGARGAKASDEREGGEFTGEFLGV